MILACTYILTPVKVLLVASHNIMYSCMNSSATHIKHSEYHADAQSTPHTSARKPTGAQTQAQTQEETQAGLKTCTFGGCDAGSWSCRPWAWSSAQATALRSSQFLCRLWGVIWGAARRLLQLHWLLRTLRRGPPIPIFATQASSQVSW